MILAIFLIVSSGFAVIGGAFLIVASGLNTETVYSLETDAFDQVSTFNKNFDYSITANPMNSTPEIRYEWAASNISLVVGNYGDSGTLNQSQMNANFLANTKFSDDIYGYVSPIKNQKYLTADNYMKFAMNLVIGNTSLDIGMYRYLSPEFDSYLAFDTFNSSANFLLNDSKNVDQLQSRFVAANDPYIIPNGGAYATFEQDVTIDTIMETDFHTGGVSVLNNSLYQLYLDFYEAARLVAIFGTTTDYKIVRDFIFDNYPYEQYISLLTLYLWAITPSARSFFQWFAANGQTYEEFYKGIGYDLSLGYKAFARYSPYNIGIINGKISLYIEDDNVGNPAYAHPTSYTVQAWNYYAEEWVNIITRWDQPQLQLVNTWLYDSFYIQMNPWQYIDPFESSDNSIHWRVMVNYEKGTEFNPTNADVRVKIGGLWTQVLEDVNEFIFEMNFKIGDDAIQSSNLIDPPVLVLEYHTNGLDTPTDTMYLTELTDVVLYSDRYLDGNYITQYLEIPYGHLNFPPNPIRDTKRGAVVPVNLIGDDTNITLRLHGRFAKYNRQGNLQNARVFFDKIAVQYAYRRNVEINRKVWFNFTNPDIVFWSYEVPITTDMISMEFNYPIDYRFITEDFSLVENPRGENISSYWQFKKGRPLFTGDTVFISPEVIYFEGTGIYRFWFWSENYLGTSYVYNASGDPYDQYDSLLMGYPTNYTLRIADDKDLIATRQEDFEGNFSVRVIGNSIGGNTITIFGPFIGTSSPHYLPDPLNPSSAIVLWNYWTVNHTHLYSEGMYGNITIEFLWNNVDFTKVAFARFQLTILYVSTEKPIVSLFSPAQDGRWGSKITNYIMAASWHINTRQAFAQIVGQSSNISLIRVSDALYGDQRENPIVLQYGVPKMMVDVPDVYKPFFWYYPINGSNIATQYILDGSGSGRIILKANSYAVVDNNEIWSDNTTVTFSIMERPNFQLYPVEDVMQDEKVRVNYYCPDGINRINISIVDNTNTRTTVSVIGDTGESTYLYKGFQTYTLPIRMSTIGDFVLELNITDDIGNQFSYQSNRFYVRNTDFRPWFMRVLDQLFELGVLIVGYVSMGIVVAVKKYRPRSTNIDLFDPPITTFKNYCFLKEQKPN